MKIESIETILLRLPFDVGGKNAALAGRDWSSLDNVLIRIDTDDGLTGWGDAFGYGAAAATKAAVDHMLAPALIGADARDIAGICDKLQRDNHIWGRYGVTLFAISGIDIALWDLAGKAAGLPLHRLLGGPLRQSVTGYASLFRYGDPDDVAARCEKALSQGYSHVKLHEREEPCVAAARNTLGDGIGLMVDVNCPWTSDEAIQMARRFAAYDLTWFEEPVFPPEDFAALARVQRDGGIALAAGENACTSFEFKRLFEAGAVRYAQPSVTKVGGITELLKIIALAEVMDVRVMPHSPYFGPGFLATLQVAAAMREAPLIERFHMDLEASPYGHWIDVTDGQFAIPDGPGLGAEPDPDVLKDFAAEV